MTLPVIATCGEAATASDVAFAFVVVTMFPVIAWLARPRSAATGVAPVLESRLAVTSADVADPSRRKA